MTKDLKEEPSPHFAAGLHHCEARLCGPWQVYGERSIYLSR
jgi:hypothetical protein